MMNDSPTDLLEVGVVIGTHGLRGDLKIRPLPTGELALPGARTVYLRDRDGVLNRYRTLRTSPHKQNILLRLAGRETLAAVAELIGARVLMQQSELPELGDDQYFWSDLEGQTVIDRTLGEIGRVVGMFTTPAHDILEVDGPTGEVLIPAVSPFLVEHDPDRGVLHVDLPEGLVPGPEDA